MEMMSAEMYEDVRRAAEVHRQTRKYAREFLKPGMSMIDICEKIEGTTRRLVEEDGLAAGTPLLYPLLLPLPYSVLEKNRRKWKKLRDRDNRSRG